jgi:hypothetical protein
MAANINAVNAGIPGEVELDDMFARIGLNVHARNQFRKVYGYRTGDEFVYMDVHKKSAMYLQSAIAVEPLALFSKRLADGVMAARHFAQYQVNRGQVPWTPATYAIGTPAESARMQNQWLERSRLVAQLSSAPPTLVIAPFTDMLRFPAFKANTAAACATTRSLDTGAFFGYLLRRTGAVTAAARAAIYENIDADLVTTTVHEGTRYEEDNRVLYRAIANSVGEGRLGAYIDTYRDTADGRGAYLALTLACYDPSLAPARIETAKEHLRHLRWVTGSNLETYIHHTLEQHAILLDNQQIFDVSDKAMVFRRGLSENERYRSVVIAMPPNTTFEVACGLVRTAVMNDTNLNRNGRAADNHGINRAANVANAPRRSAPTARTNRTTTKVPSRRSGAGTVKGHKLPKSGVQLHNGEYSPEDIKLLREHGEYEEMRAFRNQHNVGRSTNAIATSDRQDGNAASYAEQSVHSSGTRSYLSGDVASLRSNDRGNAMVVTGRPHTVAFPVTGHQAIATLTIVQVGCATHSLSVRLMLPSLAKTLRLRHLVSAGKLQQTASLKQWPAPPKRRPSLWSSRTGHQRKC